MLASLTVRCRSATLDVEVAVSGTSRCTTRCGCGPRCRRSRSSWCWSGSRSGSGSPDRERRRSVERRGRTCRVPLRPLTRWPLVNVWVARSPSANSRECGRTTRMLSTPTAIRTPGRPGRRSGSLSGSPASRSPTCRPAESGSPDGSLRTYAPVTAPKTTVIAALCRDDGSCGLAFHGGIGCAMPGRPVHSDPNRFRVGVTTQADAWL